MRSYLSNSIRNKSKVYFRNRLLISSFRRTAFRRCYRLLMKSYAVYYNAIASCLENTKNTTLFHLYFSTYLTLSSSCITPTILSSILVRDIDFHSDSDYLTFSSNLFFFEHSLSSISYLRKYFTYFVSQYVLYYFFFLRLPSYYTLPRKKKLFTVLRSPHTDKKSREQFSLITTRRGIEFPTNFIDSFLPIYKNLFHLDIMLKSTTYSK